MKKFIIIFLLLLLCVIIIGWNSFPRTFADINENFLGRFYHGRFRDETMNLEGVHTFIEKIRNHTHPDLNPLNVPWQHLWYNCFTTGYDQVVWIEHEKSYSTTSYAFYFSGKTVFLRIEPDGFNQVLKTDLPLSDYETEIANHLGPLPAEAQLIESGPSEKPRHPEKNCNTIPATY